MSASTGLKFDMNGEWWYSPPYLDSHPTAFRGDNTLFLYCLLLFVHWSSEKILKIGLTVLFTYLKIILLQCFQFLVSIKISCIQNDPYCNMSIVHVALTFFLFLCFFVGTPKFVFYGLKLLNQLFFLLLIKRNLWPVFLKRMMTQFICNVNGIWRYLSGFLFL